ncbi:hypothetical protein V7024_17640, partial [Bacillus sp. JJ864]
MPITLHRWGNTAQDRHFRNKTNENWDMLEKTHNDIEEKSEQAVRDSIEAKELAKEANDLSNNVQTQVDTIVINGDSGPEAKQARVDADGNVHETLKDRADSDFKKNANLIDLQQKIIEDMAVNIKKFGAITIALSNNKPLSSALNSNYDSLLVSKGIYRITDTINVDSGVPKKITGTKGSVILVDLPSSNTAFDIYINVEFENITFDFNNKPVSKGLLFRENLGTVKLKNCKFINVKDMDPTTSS